jgi:hypothetical protein
VPPLHHFLCHEIRREPFDKVLGVSVIDRFGQSTVDLVRPKRICNPVDKNDEDPDALDAPDHLVGYIMKQESPSFPRQTGLVATNQFGTLVFDVKKPDYFFVPSAKSLVAPPPALDHVIDHFKCYKVLRARTRLTGIKVIDEFGTLSIDVKKPRWLCTPSDKNGEGIIDPSMFLLCYKIKVTPKTPVFVSPGEIFVKNQFGPDTLHVDHPTELCLPTELASP